MVIFFIKSIELYSLDRLDDSTVVGDLQNVHFIYKNELQKTIKLKEEARGKLTFPNSSPCFEVI